MTLPRSRTLLLAAALVLALAYALVAPALHSTRAPGELPIGVADAAALRRGFWEQEALTEPTDALLARQLFGSEVAPTDVYAKASAQAQALGELAAAEAPEVAEAQWQLTGPTNIGGRILDVAVDPDVPDTVYAALATGGVWVTTDGGTTFSSIWPDHLTQAIGALTITSTGVLYVGTGETGPGGGSMTYGGDGVYRSTDRGQTWEHMGLPDSSRIGRIMVDPSNEQRVFVAASGNLYRDGGQRGLYLSEDAGQTWELVLAGDNAATGATDIAIDPKNPQRMFATMWEHRREPDIRRYTGVGSGLYRSLDGGRTWARTALGIMGPNPQLGRPSVAIAPSATDTVYINASGASGAYGGAYKSTDFGLTWTPMAHPNLALTHFVYGWWFGRIYVDPKDANHVFIMGVDLVESTDGGTNWRNISGVHADQHGMAWDPHVPNRVYLGNDGGFYRSDANGSSGWVFAKYQPYSQLYSIDVGEQNPDRMVAGLQDNGVNRSYNSSGVAGENRWNSYIGGDGERALINPKNQQIVYGCYQYGECSVSKNGGNSSSSFTTRVVSSRKNWFTPIEFDPLNPSIIYTGGEIMSRSMDDATSFSVISGELSNGPGRETNPLFKNFGTLTTIAPAAHATGIVYAGTDDGNLWYTRNANTTTGLPTWTKASDPDLPKAWITRVEVDHRNPDVAYVTYSGFRQGQDAAYILRTTDGGRNWKPITGNLPRTPLNDVNVIGDALVVAGDLGVFLSTDGGLKWYRVGTGLPNAPVNELRWHAPTKTLYAATFGRSAYKVALPFLG